MPTFDTPEPIFVTLELIAGDVKITASDRGDTVVQVRPSDESKDADVQAAAQTRAEYSDGRLLVKVPKRWQQYSFFSDGGSIDVVIELPSGSQVQGNASMADFRSTGRLSECRFKTAMGHLQVEQVGVLNLNTTAGHVTVDQATGHAEVTTGAGAVRIGEIDGSAVIKNSNGDSWVGEVTGNLRVNAANGAISVDRAHATVEAKTANGDIRIGEVRRGSVVLGTGYGRLEVGIRNGTAARLDLRSTAGRVRNALDASDGPGPSDETVEVRAHTTFGDVVIRRADPVTA